MNALNKKALITIGSIGVCVLLPILFIGGCSSCSGKRTTAQKTVKPVAAKPATTNAPAPKTPPVTTATVTKVVFMPAPLVTYATTPATLNVEYEFNVESDGKPIRVTYFNGTTFIYDAGKKFPVPPVGPKTFTDPDNPTNHVAFRIYRIR